MRERERERGRERETIREYSVFIHNVPPSLDRFGLAGIFQKAGHVSDVYIPLKHGTTIRRGFAFVRYRVIEDAWRSIRLFNGRRIRGLQVKVSMAKPKKQGQQTQRGRIQGAVRRFTGRREWRRKTNEGKGSENSHEKNSYDHNNQEIQTHIVGQPNVEFEEWLARTLVCTSAVPRDLATLDSALVAGTGLNFKLSALSCFKFLLIFPTLESMQEAMVNHQDLQQWFIEVKRWGVEDHCESRRVWLDIIGVPPHGWTWENFKAIAELWGQLICLGKPSSRIESFEVMKILIATTVLRRIEAEIIFKIGYGGYRIMIKETETISQMFIKAPHMSICTNQDDRSSDNEVPGFEDIDDNISHNGAEDEEQPPCQVQNFSNETRVEETKSNNSSRQQALSNTRTPTVSFSQNGYSEEILKVQQHLSKIAVAKEVEELSKQHSSQGPPGFEFENEKDTGLKHNEAMQSRPKDAVRYQEEAVEECPDGQSHYLCGTDIEKNCTNPNYQQKQTASKELNFREALLQTSPAHTSSDSESLVQLAQDSLKIGELLGVRVTGNMEAAISRIVSPLKKIRKQGKKLKKAT